MDARAELRRSFKRNGILFEEVSAIRLSFSRRPSSMLTLEIYLRHARAPKPDKPRTTPAGKLQVAGAFFLVVDLSSLGDFGDKRAEAKAQPKNKQAADEFCHLRFFTGMVT